MCVPIISYPLRGGPVRGKYLVRAGIVQFFYADRRFPCNLGAHSRATSGAISLFRAPGNFPTDMNIPTMRRFVSCNRIPTAILKYTYRIDNKIPITRRFSPCDQNPTVPHFIVIQWSNLTAWLISFDTTANCPPQTQDGFMLLTIPVHSWTTLVFICSYGVDISRILKQQISKFSFNCFSSTKQCYPCRQPHKLNGDLNHGCPFPTKLSLLYLVLLSLLSLIPLCV